MNGWERCLQYVDDVLLGEIPAPLTIKQACDRFLKDFDNRKLRFEIDKAIHAVEHIEKLPHTKGPWQGKPFILQPFQCFLVCNLFGWKWVDTGVRRFSRCYFSTPRKNGKTELAVAIALVMFGPDEEPGCEVLLGATSQEHAKDLLFKPAKYMVKNCDEFREDYGVEVNATTLVIPHNDSVLKAVIKKPDDGSSPYVGLVDEYHLHESADMWNVFDTGTGARPDGSLILTTTTAGHTLGGPCHLYRDDMLKLLRGDYEDETTFALIYEPDEDAEWTDIDVLRQVNPNIGVIQTEEYLVGKLNQARRSAEEQNTFRTKRLNQWVGAKTAYLNMVSWARQKREMSINDFIGEKCQVAVDMAEQKDVSSVGVMFKRGGEFSFFGKHFVPEKAFEHNDKYKTFSLAGLIEVTEGNAQDYSVIRDYIDWLAENFDIEAARFDPWQSSQMMQELQDSGLTVYKQTQQFSDFSDPMKTTETAVLDGNLWHAGDPVLTWMVGNTAALKNKDGHMKPLKGNPNNPRCKIDGCVAMIMCMKGWLEVEPDNFDDFLKNPVVI